MRLALGIYTAPDDVLEVDLREILTHLHEPDTPDNRERMLAAVRERVAEQWPGLAIVVKEEVVS